MNGNLAREFELNQEEISSSIQQPVEYPNKEAGLKIEQIPQDIPIEKGLTRLEVFLLSATTIIVFGLILLNISADFQLTAMNKDIQDISTQIEETEVEIENLKQHSYELSRYDRIHEIAEKYGLEMHEENIKNIKATK